MLHQSFSIHSSLILIFLSFPYLHCFIVSHSLCLASHSLFPIRIKLSLTRSCSRNTADAVRLRSFILISLPYTYYISFFIICVETCSRSIFFGCGEKKRYMYSILYWSEVNRNIIKPQFDFLRPQEEKALKRLWEVEI